MGNFHIIKPAQIYRLLTVNCFPLRISRKCEKIIFHCEQIERRKEVAEKFLTMKNRLLERTAKIFRVGKVEEKCENETVGHRPAIEKGRINISRWRFKREKPREKKKHFSVNKQ